MPHKTPDAHGPHAARRPSVPLRAGRCLHGLRRLPLLAAGPDRPQPLPHVDRLGTATTARAADRSSPTPRPATAGRTYPGAAAGGRRQLEDLPGHRRGPRRGALSGAGADDPYIGNYGDNSLLYFLQYQNAAPGTPLSDGARTGTNIADRRTRYVRHARRRTSRNGTLPQVSWIVAPEASPSTRTGRELRRLVHLAGARHPDVAIPRCGARRRCFITYDENDGFFDHVVPPTPHVDGHAGLSTVDTRRTRSSPGARHAARLDRRRPLRAGRARADARRLAVEQGRLGQLGGVRPHVADPVHRGSLRRRSSRTSRRGGARSAAT